MISSNPSNLFYTVCAVFSHPDDVELLCYGTLARFKKQGSSITILIVTGGKHGVSVDEERIPNLEDVRLSETKHALKEISNDIRILNLPDGAVQFNGESISMIESLFNELTPSIVLTHYTDQSGIDHQDHQNVSKIVKNICFRKNYVKFLLLTEPLKRGTDFNPNLFMQVGEFFQQKIKALSSHNSQTGRNYLSENFHTNRSSVWISFLQIDTEEHVESFFISKAIL
ncbi:MAG TPA: PIG-L deacetylase family protein [Saprospiraceae bacterium]|nr:PIG-L deacetylase family protein [Saprospiraceae bacterium]